MLIKYDCPICNSLGELDLDVEFSPDEKQTFEEEIMCEKCFGEFTTEVEIWITMDIEKTYKMATDFDGNKVFIDNYTGNLFEHAGVDYPSRP